MIADLIAFGLIHLAVLLVLAGAVVLAWSLIARRFTGGKSWKPYR